MDNYPGRLFQKFDTSSQSKSGSSKSDSSIKWRENEEYKESEYHSSLNEISSKSSSKESNYPQFSNILYWLNDNSKKSCYDDILIRK